MEGERQKKVLTFEECLQRADDSFKAKLYSAAVYHYFTILSRFLGTLTKDKNKFKEVVYKFIIGTIMLKGQNITQKERMLNFLIHNDNLNVAEHKIIFDKLLNRRLIYEEDIKKLLSVFPDFTKNINVEKALFEHNIYCLSSVFENISFSSLEQFLKIKIDVALKYLTNSILEKTISAEIDESDKFIVFIKEQGENTDFDLQIKNFLIKTKNLVDYVKK